MGILERLGARLTQSPDQLRAQEIRRFCGDVSEVDQIAECRPRSRARVVGIVQSIKYVPGRDNSKLQVRIYDGTDEIIGVWFGRREIPGVRLGQPLVLSGTIVGSRSGGFEMMNPAYELVAEDD